MTKEQLQRKVRAQEIILEKLQQIVFEEHNSTDLLKQRLEASFRLERVADMLNENELKEEISWLMWKLEVGKIK